MTLVEEFERAARTPGNGIGPFLKLMASELDTLAGEIKRQDIPVPVLTVPEDTGSWRKAFDGANGWGDVLNRLRQMAATIDAMSEVILAPAEEAEKRKPGRPRKAA
jgi:hypothetical protein